MSDDCIAWDIDERFRKVFPNGLTQEQIDKANKEMWKQDTYFCGSCNKRIAITEYPHDCPVKKK